MEEGPRQEDEAPPTPASPGQRLAGAVVDGAVLQVAGLALVGLDPAVAAAVSTAAFLAYEVSLVASRGQTLGKLAMGTKVVDAGASRLPTLWQAGTRAAVPMAGVVVDVALGTAALGFLWVSAVYGALLLDPLRRGLHDKAAGTVVRTVPRTEAHRRAGTAALAAAVVLIVVLVALAVQRLEEEEEGTEGAWPAAAVALRSG